MTNQAARVPLTSRWQLEYRNLLRCLCPSDLWLSDAMPWSGRMRTGFRRCPSPLPRNELSDARIPASLWLA